MKIRVLYPMAFANLPRPPEGGDVITLDDDLAQPYIDAGYAEAVVTKTRTAGVERATANPGEKRTVRRKPATKKAK